MKSIRRSQITKAQAVCAAFVLLWTLALPSAAQTDGVERWDNGVGHPWSLPDAPQEELDELQSRWKTVEEELKSTDNNFAGTYRVGGTSGSLLRWAPNGGFVHVHVYEWLDVVYFSYGKVDVTPSEIIFSIERERRAKGYETLNTSQSWVTAKWKHKNYFIPKERIVDFGNYTAGFRGFNDFNGPCCEFTPFFAAPAKALSAGDAERPVVSKAYEHFLKQPIEATIETVGRKKAVKDYGSSGEFFYHLHFKATLTPVRINAGRKQGVKRGMLFRFKNGSRNQYVKITRVGQVFSEAVVVRDVDDDGREDCYDFEAEEKKSCPPVIAGDKVTTSPL